MISKKIIVAIFVINLIFTSCKKDRNCECSVTTTNFTGTTTSPKQTTTYKKIKKSEAKDICQNKTITDSTLTTWSSGTGSYVQYISETYTCKLK